MGSTELHSLKVAKELILKLELTNDVRYALEGIDVLINNYYKADDKCVEVWD